MALFQELCYFELSEAAWGCRRHPSAPWLHRQTSYDVGLGE
jgi:hypothetical protein